MQTDPRQKQQNIPKAKNAILERTAHFLSGYEPFTALNEEQLLHLASHVEITHVEPGHEFFHEYLSLHPWIFIVNRGSVKLERDGQLLDIAEAGDIFGFYPPDQIGDDPAEDETYSYRAISNEESLIYRIEAKVFQEIACQFEQGCDYLKSITPLQNPSSREDNKTGSSLSFFQLPANIPEDSLSLLQSEKTVVTVSAATPVREAARIMREKKIGSLVVTRENGTAEGILTDTDFARKVGTGDVSIDAPVSEVMSSPVVTIPSPLTVFDAMAVMMRHEIRHIIVTEGEENSGTIKGIVTEHDILLAHGNNPLTLLREMLAQKNPEGLRVVRDKVEKMIRQYLESGINMRFLSTAVNELNDALVETAIHISLSELEKEGKGKPPVKFVWLSLGSEGRAEQFLRTDQDNALLYENIDHLTPEKQNQVAQWFIEFADRVNGILNSAGFEFCSAEMMARNPKWNMSLSGWQNQFSAWVRTPDPNSVMHTTIFFDFRPVYGDFNLAARLKVTVKKLIRENRAFLTYLAANALANPAPLSFFKNFLLERSGEHKNEFDIKKRALMPLIDAARVLSLEHELLHCSSTINRFRTLIEQDSIESPLQKTLEDAVTAFDLILRLRVTSGLRHSDSGRYIRTEELSRFEKKEMRTAFEAIATLQKSLSFRYRLDVLPK